MPEEYSLTPIKADQNRKPAVFYGYVVVACAFLILVIVFGTNYSFGIFFNRLLEDLGWSRAVTSTGYSAAQLLGGVVGILTGRYSDKFGPRLVVTVCGLSMAAGCFLMSLVAQPWHLYIIYGVLVGIGFGGAVIPLSAMISRWFVRLRGLMTGIAIAGIGTGTMVMPLLVNPLLNTFDWRLSFIILGGLTLVVVLPAAFFLKRDPAQIGCRAFGADEDKEENTSGRAKETGLTFRQAVQTLRFWLTAGIFFCFGIYVHTVMVHIVPQARAVLPDVAGTALIMSFLGVGSIVGRIAMGSASDRIGVKYTLMISLAVIALTFVWLLSADQLWMFYLFAVAFGFGYGAMIAMQTLTMVSMFGLVSLGTMVGVITCIYTAGGSIGPVISGYIYDVTGSYRIAFLICLGLALSGLVLALVLKGGKAVGSGVRREVKE